jgi:hypothetical protein
MTMRRKFLVHLKFQKDFTGRIFLAIFMPVIVCIVFFLLMITSALPQTLGTIKPLVDGNFWGTFLLRALPIGFAVFVFSIFFSHRIAGPIRKMQNICDGYQKGQQPPPITLRKNDYFRGFAGKLDRALHETKP